PCHVHYTLALHDALPIYILTTFQILSSCDEAAIPLDLPSVSRITRFSAHHSPTIIDSLSQHNTAIENITTVVPVLSCKASFNLSDRKSTRLNSSHVKISY